MHVLNHPLFLHKLAFLRDERVRSKQFREIVTELSLLLVYFSTQNLGLELLTLASPVDSFVGHALKDRIGLFPILRAGLGMVNAFSDMIPNARIHHLGLYREKSTLAPVEYYNKLPAQCQLDLGIVLDPMVATAGTRLLI